MSTRLALLYVTALLYLVMAVTTASADEPDQAGDETLESSADGSVEATGSATRDAPPIGEVLEAAYDAAGLARDPTRSLARRSRLAALVPWVSVRTGRDTSWNDVDPEIGHGTTVEVRATWRLDRLVFDGREIQLVSLDASRRRERRRLASRVIHSYFAWRRLADAAARQPRLALRAEEALADLDALTGGWFTGELTQRTTSAFRTRSAHVEP